MKKDFKNYISKNLEFLKKQSGLSLKRLAEDMRMKGLNINEKKLSAYLYSTNEPSINIARELATYFNLTLDRFCFTDLSPVEHKCKYCGAMTTQPDEECWNAPVKMAIEKQNKKIKQ